MSDTTNSHADDIKWWEWCDKENQDGDSDLPLSPFTGEKHFMHTIQNKDHGLRSSEDFLVYTPCSEEDKLRVHR